MARNEGNPMPPAMDREECACGEIRDDFGACWKCDAEPTHDAAAPVVLCARCTDDTTCDDHEVRS